MKVASVTYTDAMSGAGIAALRIHRSMASQSIDSVMHVLRKRTHAADVQDIGGPWTKRGQAVRARLARAVFKAMGEPRDVMLSANLLPTGLQRLLDATDSDLLHLHWLGAETISIDEIASFRTPVVWTLHDEWFYEGIDHYHSHLSSASARISFLPGRRLLDRLVRSRKAAAWKRLDPFLVAPSRWLAENVRGSGLVAPGRVHVIPNPVPIDIYRPSSRSWARRSLGLPPDHKVIGFGAVRAGTDPRKGYALLMRSLQRVAAECRDPMILLVFGAERGSEPLPLPARFTGSVVSDADIAKLYAAMDVFVCPSLQENFPNTIGEAMACGVPCVAFRVGGIPELIAHGVNGYLAAPLDADDLAKGIITCLDEQEPMGLAAREFAETALSPSLCASRYAAVYAEALRARDSAPQDP